MSLLNVLHSQSILIDMSCNVNKTVCMMFKPKRQSSIIRAYFPPLRIGVSCVQYVSNFKYLGHIIMDNLSDNGDIWGYSNVCSHDVSLCCGVDFITVL